jgi:hypothetical protein
MGRSPTVQEPPFHTGAMAESKWGLRGVGTWLDEHSLGWRNRARQPHSEQIVSLVTQQPVGPQGVTVRTYAPDAALLLLRLRVPRASGT